MITANFSKGQAYRHKLSAARGFKLNLGRLRTTALEPLSSWKFFGGSGYAASTSIHRLSISTRALKRVSRKIATRLLSSISRSTLPIIPSNGPL